MCCYCVTRHAHVCKLPFPTASEFVPFALRAPGFEPNVRIWTKYLFSHQNIKLLTKSEFGPKYQNLDQHVRFGTKFAVPSPNLVQIRVPPGNWAAEALKPLFKGIEPLLGGMRLSSQRHPSFFSEAFPANPLVEHTFQANPLVEHRRTGNI